MNDYDRLKAIKEALEKDARSAMEPPVGNAAEMRKLLDKLDAIINKVE
jgi:hypothetical protein